MTDFERRVKKNLSASQLLAEARVDRSGFKKTGSPNQESGPPFDNDGEATVGRGSIESDRWWLRVCLVSARS